MLRWFTTVCCAEVDLHMEETISIDLLTQFLVEVNVIELVLTLSCDSNPGSSQCLT